MPFGRFVSLTVVLLAVLSAAQDQRPNRSGETYLIGPGDDWRFRLQGSRICPGWRMCRLMAAYMDSASGFDSGCPADSRSIGGEPRRQAGAIRESA